MTSLHVIDEEFDKRFSEFFAKFDSDDYFAQGQIKIFLHQKIAERDNEILSLAKSLEKPWRLCTYVGDDPYERENDEIRAHNKALEDLSSLICKENTN